MPDMVTGWGQTGHATKFEDFFGSYSATRDYCAGCHTTGYNETDSAGGFDDAARLAGWSPDQGSFMKWVTDNGKTLDDIRTSPAGAFMNIQCENCHGPGSVHTRAKSFEPGVCSQCHPQEAQWRYSGHVNTGSANLHMAESTSCVECHTGQGFVEVKVRGGAPVFPYMATADRPANLVDPVQQPPVACAACHDPHAFPEPHQGRYGPASFQLRVYGNVTMPNGATVDAKESAVCVSCHADKRDLDYKAAYLAAKNSRGPHGNVQADNFYGVTGAVFDFGKGSYATSPHYMVVAEGCIQCHMAESPAPPDPSAVADGLEVVSSHGALVLNNAGGHTWSMVGSYKGADVENVAVCQACHANLGTFNRPAFGDYDGDGRGEGIQDEVKGLLAVLEARLPKNASGAVPASGIDKMDLTDVQRMAIWNYWVIANDGSYGVHNAGFAVQVLQRTYRELTGAGVPGATIR